MKFQPTHGNNEGCSNPITKIKLYFCIGLRNKLHNQRESWKLSSNFQSSINCLGAHNYNHQNSLRWFQGTLEVLYTHQKSIGITVETFHFPEAVQVFLNPITIK